ncbi:MAG: carbohydrate deacetylase [Rhizomicrobium sp.]
MRIIVNADDLGSSRKVNAAIFALMTAGRIRSATLIPNGRAFEEAVSRTGEFPHCSFGIHLNTASGPPVGNDSALPAILGADGCFRLEAVQRLFVSKRVRTAVLGEWEAQLERVRNAGVPISHIDSHHHLHTVPALFAALKHVQRDFGVARVRLARCGRQRRSPATVAVCLARTVWNHALRIDGTKTTDVFCSLPEFRAISETKRPRFRTAEIMAHAGTKAGEEDTRLLESEWWARQMLAHEMISYNEL